MDATNDSGETALHISAKKADAELMRLLLNSGASVNTKTIYGYAPIHAAAVSYKGNATCILALLNGGADVGAVAKSGYTALHFVCSKNADGSTELVHLLINSGASVNAKENMGLTPIHFAAGEGNRAIVSALVDRGADIRATSAAGITVVHACAMHGNAETLRLLLSIGATGDVNAKDEIGNAPAHYAVENMNDAFGCTSALLAAGAEVNSIADTGGTPLHQACSKKGTIELVRLLLSYGASVNPKDNEGRAPIHYAADKDDADIALALLESGADVTATTSDGETALHISVWEGNAKLVRLLLDRGAKVNAKTNQGLAPIHYASSGKNCGPCVSALHEGGADVDLPTADGKTLLHASASKGDAELVHVLLNSGANINAKDGNEFAPIHYAAQAGEVVCVTLLLERGADADLVTSEGWTALQLAGLCNAKQCVKLLKTHAARVRGFGKRSVRHQSHAHSQQPGGLAESIGFTNSVAANVLKLPSPAAVIAYRNSDEFFEYLLSEMKVIGTDQVQFSWIDAEQQFKSEFTGRRVRDEEEEKRLQAALLEAAGLDTKEDQQSFESRSLESCWSSLDDFDGESEVETERMDHSRACGAMTGQPLVDVLELAPPAVKWLENADPRGREMLLSRLTRLMQGHRSYALSKRLQNTRYLLLQIACFELA